MNERVTKIKLYFDLEKELAFINEMNAQGWKLVYIKGGCAYTFEKCEPGEYVTILHADKKENISSIQTFAAQCGYDSIPHTFDGLGDVLYLTGKKGEVDESFNSDIKSQKESYKRLAKRYTIFEIIFLIIALLLIFESVAYFALFWEFLPTVTIIVWLVTLIFVIQTVKIIAITRSLRKKVKSLEKDEGVFERLI